MNREITFKNNSKEVDFLIKKDSNLVELFKHTKEIKVNLSDDYYTSLVQTIIAQQLSTKVADVIYIRLVDLLNNDIKPLSVLTTSEDDLRSIGLSRPKIKYLKSLATHVIEHKTNFENFKDMSNQEIIDQLVEIKGIGIWTAQMFLMF